MPHVISEGITVVDREGQQIPLQIFGRHNLTNLNGALMVCRQLGINDKIFFEAIQTFKGASKRLELVARRESRVVYKDFAHAPSKVNATLKAVREQFPERLVIACLELHTYSSLNKDFLPQYSGTLDSADIAIVYFSPHALQLKRLPEITKEQVVTGFGRPGLEVCTSPAELKERLFRERNPGTVLLMMSSGNYDGIDVKDLGENWVTLG
jgi:UDP-N-acetylmuramate: L-alanyl-gamma-D-glutamyl-meso-diaminopimelate ligase